jgi:Bacterial Ig-like domain (group 3)
LHSTCRRRILRILHWRRREPNEAKFTATVVANPPGTGTPGGQVEFTNRGGPQIDLVVLDLMARASTNASAPAGLYTVDAAYSGDNHFNASSGSVDTRVNKAATNTTLTISPNPAVPGATITFSAIVTILPPGDAAPAGSLQFTIDGAPFGAALGLGGGTIGYEGSLIAPPSRRSMRRPPRMR